MASGSHTGGENQIQLVYITYFHSPPLNKGVPVVFATRREAGTLVFNQGKVIACPPIGRPGKTSHYLLEVWRKCFYLLHCNRVAAAGLIGRKPKLAEAPVDTQWLGKN